MTRSNSCQIVISFATRPSATGEPSSAKLAKAAIRSQTDHIPSSDVEYGFGWRVSSAAGQFSHGGSDGTWSFCDTQRQIIGLVYTQSPRGGVNPKERFRDLVTAACRDSRKKLRVR